ncbi:transmembrane protein 71 [Rhinoderma darwinii]|uniref:transmembrane protein 71 n=1 Tax=Rhinoderma darwinii TaxID=43563 RepID=UPI003F678F3C
MNSDFFKMAAQPPMMSTPIKGKYSSFFQDIALLPYRLFGHFSRDNSNTQNMGSPKNGSPIPSAVNMSPCRHSLRLISNGYYVCDEDSFCWDDLGNISFSPTQCTVSYKENMVRIFRKRRRTLAQRRLDLTIHGNLEDRQHYEEIKYIEPLMVEQIYHSSSENLDLCDSGNTSNIYPPTLLEIVESDTDYASSGYSQYMNNGNAAQCHPEKWPTISCHAGNSTKMLQPEYNDDKSSHPVPPGIPQNVNNESANLMSPLRRLPRLEEKDNGDRPISRYSCGGYVFVDNDTDTCRFSDNISSWGPTERRLLNKHSSDSIATTLMPSIESVSMDVDDTRQRRITHLTLVFIPFLLLCLIFWWFRLPDYDAIL